MHFLTQTFLSKAAGALLSAISPILLSEIQAAIIRFRISAKKSASPWDDILVDMLESLFINISDRDD